MKLSDSRAQIDHFEMAENYDFFQGIRGRFNQPKKVSTTIHLDDDLLLFFKKKASEQHVGYQTLINALLRDYVKDSIGPS